MKDEEIFYVINAFYSFCDDVKIMQCHVFCFLFFLSFSSE